MISKIKQRTEIKKQKVKKKQKIKKKERVNKKRLAWFLVIVTVIALALLFFSFKEQILGSLNIFSSEFKHNNITWHKEKFENLTLWTTPLSIYRISENKTYLWTIYLRNDPRKLDKISVDIIDMPSKKLYVAFDGSVFHCNDTMISAWTLGEFFGVLGINASGAVTDAELLDLSNISNGLEEKVKTCADAKEDANVVLLKEGKGEKSRIYQDNYCYILEIANCEIIEVSERFILGLIDIMREDNLTSNE